MEYTVLWIESLETTTGIGVRSQKMLIRRDQRFQLVLGDVDFDQLCSGREGNIEDVIGPINYRLAWKYHRSGETYKHPIYIGPRMEEVIPVALCRQTQLRCVGKI